MKKINGTNVLIHEGNIQIPKGKYNFSFQSKIAFVVKNFDYEFILRVMKYLNWEYALPDGNRVPSLEEIIILSERLMNLAVEEYIKENSVRIALKTGGFVATVDRDEVELSFEFENFSSEAI